MDKVRTFGMLLLAAFLGAILSNVAITVSVRDPRMPVPVQPVQPVPKPVEPGKPGFDPGNFQHTMGQK